jgi:hypothetical protein
MCFSSSPKTGNQQREETNTAFNLLGAVKQTVMLVTDRTLGIGKPTQHKGPFSELLLLTAATVRQTGFLN